MIVTETKLQTHCYHCGESCIGASIYSKDKNFCCFGCKTVYEILNENDLCTYYDLDTKPGTQQKEFSNTKFDYLANNDIADKLLDFSSEQLIKVTLLIPAIHCSSCIFLLEHLNRVNNAVISSRINFSHKKVSIDYKPENFNLKDLAVLLTGLGYEPEINLNSLQKKQSENKNYFFLKLGVAGFCFGNIMLLSFPDYFGFELELKFQEYFTFLSFALSLPVILYSSSDYFYAAFLGLKKGYANIDIPIALGIASLFLRSSFEVITQTGTGYFDSLSGLIFFLLIGKWFQNKTYKTLSFNRDYTSYFPLAITRIKDNHSESVLVNDLNIGDKILVRSEEIIPADAVLVSEEASIDYSFVTGESAPVKKQKNDKIYAGGRIKGLAAIFHVIKPVSQNYLTHLWNNEAFDKQQTNQAQFLIDRISKYFTIAIILIAIVSGIIWSFYDVSQSFFVFTAVLIVACPCALALATPFTLGSVLNVLGRYKFYLKDTKVIESLWKIDQIVFDKTGTLSINDSKEVKYEGRSLSEVEKCNIKALTQNSTHPMSQLIHDYLESSKVSFQRLESFEEEIGQGIIGKFEKETYKIGSSRFVNGSFNDPFNTSGSVAYISINELVIGAFTIQHTYRPQLNNLIKQLESPYSLAVLSGDNEKEVEKLSKLFGSKSNLHFNQKPEDKLKYIKHLQEMKHQVMMIGDGLNDAGALKVSDFGIAVTDDMSAFTPASDAILQGDKLQHLGKFLRFVKQSKYILMAAFTLSFLYNLIGLFFAVTGNLTPIFAAILMPISSITVVVFSTLAVHFLSKHSLNFKP